ncbi:hypothetical protein EYF80_000240 [Liparis tanakae]|uniref:Uncharacterized protein n=1 Tax=Liparis tanakae TaxID=230148 RepID=A0A4Z2JI37_9TELE|nr:hypothetical protein EYF80_000240 [Liparis tanakae]
MEIEKVQSRDGGFFRFLDLPFGHFDSAHGYHSADGKVSRNAAYAQPEGPVQAVVQDNQHEEVLPMIGHPLGQSVVPHGGQETQYTQGTEKSWKKIERGSSEATGKGQTDQCETHSHQQEEDHHHVKAAIQRPHKLWENYAEKKHK